MNSAPLTITVLGSGSSAGVPRIGGDWGACDPNNPKNRRRRCSILVQQGDPAQHADTTVLVDTSPDLREQLLDAGVGRLDAVVYTHDHADQTHGIDDLRLIALTMRRRVPVYADASTSRSLTTRFGYCFEQIPGTGYPPILDMTVFDGPIRVQGNGGAMDILPFPQQHGPIISYGFRIGPAAYSADVNGIPEQSFEVLEGIDLWILDALRYTPHPSHANVEMALSWIDRVRPKRAVLTNLHVDLDYETLKSQLPPGVEPAYDGMQITI